MPKRVISVIEKITNYHEIIVQYKDNEELDSIVKNLPVVDDVDDFGDYVHKLREMGVNVVETSEQVDWEREPIEYNDDYTYNNGGEPE